jgi:hypothetical protein
MSVQNVTARRGAVISGVAAAVLLVFVAAFDNQWAESWRYGRIGSGPDGAEANSWISLPIKQLDTLAWRATRLHGEPTSFFAGDIAAALLAVVLTGLLVALVCRGVSAERGRWPLFLGSWLATGLGTGLALVVGALIAGNHNIALAKGSTYYSALGAGFDFALFMGWVVGFAAVLAYGSTLGMDDVTVASEYSAPSGYDYEPASPGAAAYSYSPTSPYGSSSGYGTGYGSSGSSGSEYGSPGYGSSEYVTGGSGYRTGSSATEPTHVVPGRDPDPFGGRASY